MENQELKDLIESNASAEDILNQVTDTNESRKIRDAEHFWKSQKKILLDTKHRIHRAGVEFGTIVNRFERLGDTKDPSYKIYREISSKLAELVRKFGKENNKLK